MKVKKGDKVKIIAGDDKGKTGVITKCLPKLNKVIVEGVNIVKKHKKARKQGEKGSIIEMSLPINVSNVSKI